MHKCADCDEINPQWGSLNKGVVLCDECSSIHRHLGRHVSQIKHLTKSRWRKTQLAMLKTLSQAGANKYWEHLLIEFSLKTAFTVNHANKFSDFDIKFRKPTPKDSLHSTKNDFIKEKYFFFGFFKKPRVIVIDDLNQQLHASVRTSILESSLYLLTLGARANYRHPVRGTSPLHVATMYNQPLQVELLLAYGADLLQVDGAGDTALQIANKMCQSSDEPLKWQVLITCLLEAQFEITDTLSYYLCRQTIDHSLNDLSDSSKMINHFLIPKLTEDSVISNSKQNLNMARDRLQLLPNDAFIDLCLDICDEIDRRDSNDILSSYNQTKELNLFFLPPNPNYSSTRNQGRQKLARLLVEEFRTLCLDALVQASLRLNPQSKTPQIIYNHPPLSQKQSCSLPLGVSLDSCLAAEDKDPVYDQVAGDSDYAYILDLQRPHESSLPNAGLKNPLESKRSLHSILKSKRISMPIEIKSQIRASESNEKSFTNLLNKVDDLTGRNKLLQMWNTDLEIKVKSLESQVYQLKEEKSALLVALSSQNAGRHDWSGTKIKSRSLSNKREPRDYRNNVEESGNVSQERQHRALMSPTMLSTNTSHESVYDTGSDLFSSGPWLRQEIVSKGNQMDAQICCQANSNKIRSANNRVNMENLRNFAEQQASSRDYGNIDNIRNPFLGIEYRFREDISDHSSSNQSNIITMTSSNDIRPVKNFIKHNMYLVPDQDDFVTYGSKSSNEVVNCVETIILQIRVLLDIANERKRGDFLHCSKSIKLAVQNLVRLFAGTERRYMNTPMISTQISTALRDLLGNSRDLRIKCEKRGNVTNRGATATEQDTAAIIQHAHEIARAAKLLLAHYQYEDY